MGEMRQQQITVSLVTNADFTGDRHVADMNLTVNGRKPYGELFKENNAKSL